ncbi:MAG: hypothetical protein IJF48_05580, partial [Clostridia bacterium]|nr:hypothetical protein [Clostridia bacterium]
NMMWAMLLNLGSNMWSKKGEKKRYTQDTLPYHETMHCDKAIWREITDFMAESGFNTVVINIGEGVKLDSHPEISVPGAWSKDELKAELSRLRNMGITPIPKFNFSCAHNAWMKDYGFAVNTPEYHKFCRDIIEETIEIFDTPKFFHLGLNDENGSNQEYFPVTIVRSPKVMIEDANVLFKACLENGVRPWIWVDPTVIESFGGKESFLENVPKSVLLSNLYMGNIAPDFPDIEKKDQQSSLIHMSPSALFRNPEKTLLHNMLDEQGYEHIPAGSSHLIRPNMLQTMSYCDKTIKNKDKLLGYITVPMLLTDSASIYGLKADATLFKAGKDYIAGTGRMLYFI